MIVLKLNSLDSLFLTNLQIAEFRLLRTYRLQVVGCTHKRCKPFSFTPKSEQYCKLQAKLSRLCQFAGLKVSTKLRHGKLRLLNFEEVTTYSAYSKTVRNLQVAANCQVCNLQFINFFNLQLGSCHLQLPVF